mmetsp:Transcript_42380/g.136954  ORF Transcript_42380/g.136954 Transcript_42380/m.136954 type:complete len:241 (-) Transcript_42380:374-1096(-)
MMQSAVLCATRCQPTHRCRPDRTTIGPGTPTGPEECRPTGSFCKTPPVPSQPLSLKACVVLAQGPPIQWRELQASVTKLRSDGLATRVLCEDQPLPHREKHTAVSAGPQQPVEAACLRRYPSSRSHVVHARPMQQLQPLRVRFLSKYRPPDSPPQNAAIPEAAEAAAHPCRRLGCSENRSWLRRPLPQRRLLPQPSPLKRPPSLAPRELGVLAHGLDAMPTMELRAACPTGAGCTNKQPC